MKYLVIGGAGFIGSHLSKALLEAGNEVVVLDNSPTKTLHPAIKRYVIDIENAKKVAAVFGKEKPDVVFHLAGAINLRQSIDSPLFAEALKALIHQLQEVSRTRHILLCRVQDQFSESEANQDFLDDVHFSARGHEKVAGTLAEFLASQLKKTL